MLRNYAKIKLIRTTVLVHMCMHTHGHHKTLKETYKKSTFEPVLLITHYYIH